jgi:hypothetical protein
MICTANNTLFDWLEITLLFCYFLKDLNLAVDQQCLVVKIYNLPEEIQ